MQNVLIVVGIQQDTVETFNPFGQKGEEGTGCVLLSFTFQCLFFYNEFNLVAQFSLDRKSVV